MNEHRNNQNEPKLSDDQMDGLLSSFFDQEIPNQLKQLPSDWAEIQNEKIVPAAVQQKTHHGSQRLIAAGASLAAACLLVFAITNPFSSPPAEVGPGTAAMAPPVTAESVLDQDATMNVSSDSDDLAIDDVNTTLEEIDMIDLSPLSDDKSKVLDDPK